MTKEIPIKHRKIISIINVILYLIFIFIAFYDYYTTRKFIIPAFYITLFGVLFIMEVRAIIKKNYSSRLFLSSR